ncbi:hypothetical protein Drorol1_Dr00000180 [Drosera rotundifolia]
MKPKTLDWSSATRRGAQNPRLAATGQRRSGEDGEDERLKMETSADGRLDSIWRLEQRDEYWSGEAGLDLVERREGDGDGDGSQVR